MENNLELLITEGENLHVEFVFQPKSELEIAKTICAFTNTEGGKLLIGIRKNGKIAGTEPSESYSFITHVIETFCKPIVQFESNIHQIGHKIILEINVLKSNELTSIFNENEKWIPYIRIKNQSVEAKSVLKKYLKLNRLTIENPFEFSEEVKNLLAVFELNKALSLTQLLRKTEIKKERIELLIAQLICWNKIKFDLSGDIIFYSLNNER